MENVQEKKEKKRMNIYLDPLNSLIGHNLIDKLKKQDDNVKYQIIGRKDENDESEVPLGVSKVFSQDFDFNQLKLVLMDVDVIIFELMKIDFEELEKILYYFEDVFFEKHKKIILISSPLIWYESVNKKPDCNNESDIFLKNQDITNTITTNEDTSGNYIDFEDSTDFGLRRTLPAYEIYRLLENKLIQLGNLNHSIKTMIFLPGIIYGKGEDDFYQLFNNCLYKNSLNIYMEGNNLIPSVYIDDCISCLMLLITEPDLQQTCFFCMDKSRFT